MTTRQQDESQLHIARRVEDISASSIFRINQKAADLAAADRDILRLDAGEPDFNTSDEVIEAAKQALDDGFTRYTPIGGLASLKEAIRQKFIRDNNLDYSLEEILVTCGAKQALFNACMTLVHPMDEVVIPTPSWGSYPAMAKLAWGQVVEARAHHENGFMLTADELDAALNKHSRVLFLNTPTNPTGRVYDRNTLAALGEVLEDYPDVFILSDDIYEHLHYIDEPFCNIVNVCPSLKDRTLVINGMSKAYAMTGWRVGFAAGPAHLIEEMQKLQGQSTSHTAAVSQKAAEAALNRGLDAVHRMVDEFGERAQLVADGLAAIDAIDCHPAQGSFYCFPDFTRVIECLDEVEDDQQLADWLLDELGIAMVPGSSFGSPGHMRLSFAADSHILHKAMTRLKEAFGELPAA